MLIGLYGSHHINIPTKHFNFQLSIFNFTHSSIYTIKHSSNSSFSIFNFQFLIFLPSLCLRCSFALGSLLWTASQRPQKGSSTELDMPPATATVATVPFSPKSVIRVGNALRNSYSVTVPFPHCTTQPQSVFLNCNNCNVTPTNIILPCRRIVVFLQIEIV